MWPIVLTHHPRSEAHRCARIGPIPVCRRCAATWPVCFAVLMWGVARILPPAHPLEAAAWLALPVGEYVAVHTGALPYSGGRTWLMGTLLGAGLGRTFHLYVLAPTDPMVWVILAAAALPMLGAALIWHRQNETE